MNWRDISYLESGTPRQRQAHAVLTSRRILNSLCAYDPVLVSTICVDIDIPTSDLDIVCHAPDLEAFQQTLASSFCHHGRFLIRYREGKDPTIICTFIVDNFKIEIFGNAISTEQQTAYLHLMAISRLIGLSGPWFRENVRARKQTGLKTEPAVSDLLGLVGDPYEQVLALNAASDGELQSLLKKAYNKNESHIALEYPAGS